MLNTEIYPGFRLLIKEFSHRHEIDFRHTIMSENLVPRLLIEYFF
jgi:hypothetical protein